MKNIITITIVCLIINGVSLSGFYLYNNSSKPKTAYIETAQAFNEFLYQKELSSKLGEVVNSRKQILDSLENHLQEFAKEIEFSGKESIDENELQKFEYQRQEYYTKKQEFEEDNQVLTKKYDSQIWTQINQYITDYGNDNGYEYIYGASGSGNLMFANDSKNITKEIIAYINDKYKGVK